MHYCCLCRGKSQAENTVGGGYVVKLPSIGPTWQWQPHLHVLQLKGATKQTTTLQCSKKLPKIIQQSKRLGGGHSNRRLKIQRGTARHLFAGLGLLPHNNTLQSTSDNFPMQGSIIDRNATTILEFGYVPNAND